MKKFIAHAIRENGTHHTCTVVGDGGQENYNASHIATFMECAGFEIAADEVVEITFRKIPRAKSMLAHKLMSGQ